MSAFVISKTHVNAIVDTALHGPKDDGWHVVGHQTTWRGEPGEWNTLSAANVDQVGQMLMDECVESVSYRYPNDTQDELPGTMETVTPPAGEPFMVAESTIPYQHRYGSRLTPVECLKALDCYEYQSCEHPGFLESEAHAFCESLRANLISMLPGYSEAAWEINESVTS